MIFVTVGTHEQQFNRLILEIDELKKNGNIEEEVFIQTGYSDYQPKYCEWKNFLEFEEMDNYIKSASIVITHGGPASFMNVLSYGKVPIVVPRKKKFEEHINDHQVDFAYKAKNNGYNILIVDEVVSLESCLKSIKANDNCNEYTSHNNEFIVGLISIIHSLGI